MATKKLNFSKAMVLRALDSVGKTYGAFKEAVEVAAAAVCVYAMDTSNDEYANLLLERCGGMKKTAVRTDALRRWLVAFGPFNLVEDADGKSATLKFAADKAKAIRAEGTTAEYVQRLRLEPFYSFKPQKDDWKGYDFAEAFSKFIEQATRANTNHGDDPKCHVTTAQIKAANKAKARIIAAA